MYKKFCSVKSALDAKNLVVTIRNRQRALHFLEAMAFKKYVAYQHGFSIQDGKVRFHLFCKIIYL